MKSTFSKPGFLGNNGTFSLQVRDEISSTRGAAESGKSGNSDTKEQRMVIHEDGGRAKPASMPATVQIPQLALTWQIIRQGTDLGSFTEATFI